MSNDVDATALESDTGRGVTGSGASADDDVEFVFDSEDAVGHRYATRTQLKAAVECSEQSITGGARQHVTTSFGAGERTVIEYKNAVVDCRHEVCRQRVTIAR